MSTETPKLLQSIKNYWVFILFIGALIITWTTTNNTVLSDTQRISAVESKQATYDAAQTQILVQLSQIQSDLTWLKNNAVRK